MGRKFADADCRQEAATVSFNSLERAIRAAAFKDLYERTTCPGRAA